MTPPRALGLFCALNAVAAIALICGIVVAHRVSSAEPEINLRAPAARAAYLRATQSGLTAD